MNKVNKQHGKITPNLSKFKLNNDDDMDDKLFGGKQLGYFTSQQVSTCLTVPIDEAVREPQYYRQVVQAIGSLGEDDVVRFMINTPGGDVQGLTALLAAKDSTDALSIACIEGWCHSAGSFLALNCDSVQVSPYATMLCHYVSYGSVGKAADIRSHVKHTDDVCEKLFRDTYKHFLTEDEIQQCINGLELWLNADEINRRLEHKYSILNAEDEVKVEPVVTAEEEEEWTSIAATIASVPKAKKAGKPKSTK
jgi:ATP-dependent protease ClpP protease subunit